MDEYNAEIAAGPNDFFYLGSLVRLLLSEARDLLALNRLLKPVPAAMPEFAPQADNMLAALARILPRLLATLDEGSAALAYFPMQNALAKEFQQSMRARVEDLYKEYHKEIAAIAAVGDHPELLNVLSALNGLGIQ